MSEHTELMTIADTIDNNGWHAAALKVRAAAERIRELEACMSLIHAQIEAVAPLSDSVGNYD